MHIFVSREYRFSALSTPLSTVLLPHRNHRCASHPTRSYMIRTLKAGPFTFAGKSRSRSISSTSEAQDPDFVRRVSRKFPFGPNQSNQCPHLLKPHQQQQKYTPSTTFTFSLSMLHSPDIIRSAEPWSISVQYDVDPPQVINHLQPSPSSCTPRTTHMYLC
ncbi:hypothetical protein FRC03_004546 [Tulasnella sp. 419]|nr:hypothetical protein FRC03_004546 [Tulasnella sp. 419]